jgi:radical SAM protein with 4Fe4S-binding SPASM domain
MSPAQRANLLRAGFNLAYRRLAPWSWPLHMQVELTSFCNLRCPVCPLGTGELHRPAQAIDVALFERLIEEVGPYLLTLSLWAWGEPLLHPDLERILAAARRYPAATLLSTNGQNLDHDPVQQALRNQPPAYLIVAIDGLSDQTNSQYRKGARLQPALDGVRALAEWKRRTASSRPVLHCRFLAMRHNEHELADLRSFATDAGFDMVSIRALSIIDSAEAAHRDLLPSSESLRAYAYQDGRRSGRRGFLCQHAFSFPTVLADGTVVACEQDFNGSQAYGKFAPETSFAAVWRSRHAAAIRKIIRDDPARFSFCLRCPFAGRATSSCSIQSYFLRP